jgi:hypothetical protein
VIDNPEPHAHIMIEISEAVFTGFVNRM